MARRCTAAWCCPRRCRDRQSGYGLHPALLDAALHVLGLADGDAGGGDGSVLLPFEWSEVAAVRDRGAGAARACVGGAS